MAASEVTSPSGALIASPATQLAVTAQNPKLVPVRPNMLSDSDNTELNNQAQTVVDMFIASPTDLRIAATIGQIGSVSSFAATQKTNLINVKILPLLKATNNEKGAIPTGLSKMRTEIEAINPAKIYAQMNQGWVGSVLALVSEPMKRALNAIAEQYETAQDTIDKIVEGLLLAKGGLQADNVELATMIAEVDECLANIRKDAYQSELVFQGISQRPIPSEQVAARTRDTIIRRLISRVEDLRTMEAALSQLSVEARSIYADNDDLSDAIDRSATITRALLTVGLVNAIALHKQKKTIGVVKDQRKYNNELLQSLATAAGLGAIEIAKLMENPAVTYNSLSKAHTTLITKLDEADSIKRKRVASALETLPKLRAMSADLTERGERLSAGSTLAALGDGNTQNQ
jgi:uncharacterized protein YaaN involved in tellurite resistance